MAVAVSTSGISPVLARLLKNKIATTLPKNLDLLEVFIGKNQNLVKDKLSDLQARRLFWQEVFEGEIAVEIESGNLLKAQNLLTEKLLKNDNQKQAAVYFIGAGPGDADLITLKAIKLLSRADVVLYDRLVADEILNYARKDAVKINKFYPLLELEEAEIWRYLKDNNVPYNVLYDQGFKSIGCAPCTREVEEGGDARSGLWWWEDDGKKECGIHNAVHGL